MGALTILVKQKKISGRDYETIKYGRRLAQLKAKNLNHRLNRWSPVRLSNYHPTTVAICQNCSAAATIVLRPADGSDPVGGTALTQSCITPNQGDR